MLVITAADGFSVFRSGFLMGRKLQKKPEFLF